MNKREFLEKLGKGLSDIPKGDADERIDFYSEMIDDRIDEGLSEEEAVANIGSVEDIAAQIVEEISGVRKANKKAGTKRKMKTWEIVLLAVGSPIWLALAIAAAAIVISVFAVIWSVLVALWAVPVSLIACLPAGIFALVLKCIAGNVLSGLAMLGIGLAASGLAIFAVYGCIWATKGTWELSKLIVIGIKSMFVGREDTK